MGSFYRGQKGSTGLGEGDGNNSQKILKDDHVYRFQVHENDAEISSQLSSLVYVVKVSASIVSRHPCFCANGR